MGKAFNGPYGHLQGKVGKLVHYMLKGQPVVRVVGAPSEHRSLKQRANQQAMKAIMDLLRPALHFINVGFELQARDTVWNPHNLAISYNKKHALKGTFPELSVDYSKVQLSAGTLPVAKDLTMQQTAEGIRINWNTVLQDQGDWNDDIVMAIALFPGTGRAVYQLNIAQRGAGTCLLAIPGDLLDKPAAVYLVFKSADGRNISKTAYAGQMNGSRIAKAEKRAAQKEMVMKKRLASLERKYVEQIEQHGGKKPENKAFLKLAADYEMLKQRLKGRSGQDG